MGKKDKKKRARKHDGNSSGSSDDDSRRRHTKESRACDEARAVEAVLERWAAASFLVVDKINVHKAGAPEQRLDQLALLGRLPSGAPAAAVDMSDFSRLADYVRTEFEIEASIQFALSPQSAGSNLIYDDTSMWSFLSRVEPSEQPIMLAVVQVAERGRRTPRPAMPAVDLSGAAVLSQAGYDEALKDAIYSARGRHPVGALTPRAMDILACNPDRLLAFDMLQSVMGRVTGNPHHLLNPVAALCPLRGHGCSLPSQPEQEGQILLNHANDLGNLINHLRHSHQDDPRAREPRPING